MRPWRIMVTILATNVSRETLARNYGLSVY
jgi:hypothetical protein